MDLRSKPFGSRVARRIFLSFVLASLIPVGLTALLAFAVVGNTLRARAREELAQSARSAGHQLLERLMLAASTLETLDTAAGGKPAMFDAALVESGGVRRPLFGDLDGASIPNPTDVTARKPMLVLRPGPQGPKILLAVRAGATVAVARIDPDYLWETASLRPPRTDVCVLVAGLAAPLFCSRPLPPAAEAALEHSMANGTAGNFVWRAGADGERMASQWELFLPSRFAGRSWTVVVSEPTAVALQSLGAFNDVFAVALIASLIVIVLLSASQIRRVLGPIERLVEGTKRIGKRRFSTRVDLGRDDEFGQLGQAMNTMAEQLGRQFDTLTALADIDRKILSSADIDEVLDAVLDRLARIVPGCSLGILLIDPDQGGRGRLQRLSFGGEREGRRVEVPVPLCEWLRARPQGGTADVGAEADLPADLPADSQVLRSPGPALLIPLLQDERVRGALIARRPGGVIHAAERDSLREFSARLVVAVTAAERERQLFERAHFDTLTGLPNRQLCYDRLRQALAQARRDEHRLAVLFIDLDGFKNINDSFGHTSGDALLREVADRLTAKLREGDTVARLGGDEYVVILPHVGDAVEVEQVASEIAKSLEEPFEIDGRETALTASVGMTVFPDDAATVEELLRKADTAMYSAKDGGRGRCVFFADEMDHKVKERLLLQLDLGQALANGEFFLVYQPQLDLARRRIVCAEALLRWQHPVRGIVSPAVFVPVLEETGLIDAVGRWVLRTALRDFAGWRRAGLHLERIAVNVASRQLFDPAFPSAVERCLSEHGLEGTHLELELTEASFVADFAGANSMLDDLRRAGASIAIDDFGTGYSSLGYLKGLTFDALKIDRTFVDGIPDPTSIAIVHAVMAVARSLGKNVVAEGIETEEQLRELTRMGCHLGQGFLFGRPCEASELPARAAALAAGGYQPHDEMTGRERIVAVVVNAESG